MPEGMAAWSPLARLLSVPLVARRAGLTHGAHMDTIAAVLSENIAWPPAGRPESQDRHEWRRRSGVAMARYAEAREERKPS